MKKRLRKLDGTNFSSEVQVREELSIPGVPLNFLRLKKSQENGRWSTIAGNFDNWPTQFSDLKILDPCCGSGHFLVSTFLMLVPMRINSENLSINQAIDAVLKENIHGVEIDQRCVELAAFALAITAWKYPSSDGYRILPNLNLACSGLSLSVSQTEWGKTC